MGREGGLGGGGSGSGQQGMRSGSKGGQPRRACLQRGERGREAREDAVVAEGARKHVVDAGEAQRLERVLLLAGALHRAPRARLAPLLAPPPPPALAEGGGRTLGVGGGSAYRRSQAEEEALQAADALAAAQLEAALVRLQRRLEQLCLRVAAIEAAARPAEDGHGARRGHHLSPGAARAEHGKRAREDLYLARGLGTVLGEVLPGLERALDGGRAEEPLVGRAQLETPPGGRVRELQHEVVTQLEALLQLLHLRGVWSGAGGWSGPGVEWGGGGVGRGRGGHGGVDSEEERGGEGVAEAATEAAGLLLLRRRRLLLRLRGRWR